MSPAASQMSARARWRRGLLVLGAVVLLVLGSVWIHPRADGLALDVQPVPLNPSDPGQTEAGPLRFRGGLWLRSADPRFGGLSDLRVTPDRSQLLAVSDCGRGFVATLVHDSSGRLTDLRSPRLVDLVGSDGGVLQSWSERDAEGLAFDGDDGLLVSFEVRPRIWRYARSPPFAGPSRPWPAPPVDEACRGNRSLETLVDLGGGRLFMACEAASARQDSVAAWVGAGETWVTRSYPLGQDGLGRGFTPTAAARLPGGDLLVLERRFPPLDVRLMRLSKADLEDTGPFEPREIARLAAPLSVDNFEGLDVRPDSSGTTLLYLLSDDNGCSKQAGVIPPRLQRTLLLLFELTD